MAETQNYRYDEKEEEQFSYFHILTKEKVFTGSIALLFALIGIFILDAGLVSINLFFLNLMLLSWMFLKIYSLKLEVYRKHKKECLTGQKAQIEIGAANYNAFSYPFTEIQDNFRAETYQRPEIFFKPVLRAHKITTGKYSGNCGDKRGRYILGPAVLHLTGMFGLSDFVKVFDAPGELKVYPHGYKIKNMPFLSNASTFNVNIKNSAVYGSSDEFTGMREYARGDSFRKIHWKTSLRAQKLIVKLFEQPASKNVCIFMDLYEKTARGVGKHSTVEYAVKTALAVAENAVAGFHKVSLIAEGKKPVYIAPAGTAYGLKVIMEYLLDIKQNGSLPFSELLLKYAHGLPVDSAAVLIFSCALINIRDYINAVNILKSKNINVTAIIINDIKLVRSKKDVDYSLETDFNNVINVLNNERINYFIVDVFKEFKLYTKEEFYEIENV